MKRIQKHHILFPLLLFTAACSYWNDFTTYFNRYYNAKNLFETSLEDVARQERELFAFKEEKITNAANANFEKVIEKCSKIMQFDTTSAYFDEAIYMTGVAFYYQQNYSKALRKFRELEAYPENSDLKFENIYWIAKSEMQMRNFDLGMQLLDSVKVVAVREEEEKLVEKAYIAQIAFYIYREQFQNSVNLMEELISVSESDELKAEVVYELGKLYLTLGDLEKAANSFVKVDEFAPTFDLQFDSRLEYAKVLRQLEREAESIDLLEDMRYDNKFQDKRDQVELELALVALQKGDIGDAFTRFSEIDSLYTQGKSLGIARFNIAYIYEKFLGNYDSAMTYYDKSLASDLNPEYRENAKARSGIIVKYISLDEKIAKENKDLIYLTEPETFARDSVEYVLYRASQGDTTEVVAALTDSTIISDSTAVADSTDQQTTAMQPRPGRSQAGTNLNQLDLVQSEEFKVTVKPIYPKFSADSAKTLLSKSYFELGNLFLTELEVPDSAFIYYNKSLKLKPEGSLTPQTLYAVGSYYNAIGDTTRADSMYTLVYDKYPENDIAVEAARKLGRTVTTAKGDPSDKIFLKGEELYLAKNFDAAIDTFRTIFENYPESPNAPKSLYSIGFILENDKNMLDSAASVYDTLVTHFKRSEYTLAVNSKLEAYKNEQAKIQAHLDSLKTAQSDSTTLPIGEEDEVVIQDSTGVDLSEFIPEESQETDPRLTPPPPDDNEDQKNLKPKEEALPPPTVKIERPDSSLKKSIPPPAEKSDTLKDKQKSRVDSLWNALMNKNGSTDTTSVKPDSSSSGENTN